MGLFGYNVYLECVVILHGKSAIYFVSGFQFNLDAQNSDLLQARCFFICALTFRHHYLFFYLTSSLKGGSCHLAFVILDNNC